jgi:predicted PurR-regulated permease PerM
MLTGIALVVLFVLAYFVVDVFLLVFAGVLFAIMLRMPADAIAERTRLPAHWALAAVIALLLIVLAGAAWLFGHTLAEQMTTLARRLPELIEQLRERIADFGWLVTLPNPEEWLTQSSGFIGRGFSVLAATFGAVANLLVVFFTGVFFAAQPGLYCRGLLALVPAKHEQRAAEVMDATAHTLRWWLFGQLCLMLLIGAVTGIGLWLLGVPYAFALAVIAGLLEFIPYIGPVLSAVPAVLVALAESPTLALYVALLYLGIQFFEGNIIQPLVQQRTVYLPPAAILISQVVLGVLIGALGVMLATPLAATVMVWTRMLYVEDALGKRVSAAGR